MAMTSVTRSTRSNDGLKHNHVPRHLLAANTRSFDHNHRHSHLTASRSKRQLEPSQRDFDIIKPPKRARIAVEILSKADFHARNAIESSNARSAQAAAKPPPPPPPPPPAAATATPIAPPKHRGSAPAAVAATTTTTTPNIINNGSSTNNAAASKVDGVTKHQDKVAIGLKHELDRLKPSKEDATLPKEQGRKLRSQEATRFKSELSAYFPDYDEVIGNDPKEEHILNLDTPIVITGTDSASQPVLPQPAADHPHRSQSHAQQYSAVRGYADNLFTDLWDSQRIDFGFLEVQYRGKALEDPLPDSVFEPSHRKAERLERSIRNSEKGRAQHEKDQIIRLLDGLHGPDWLRVMGVSGITETRKKTFEPARRHFIKGCEAILDKFRSWAAEEKRRKLEKEEKERAAAEAEAEAEEEAEEEGVEAGTDSAGEEEQEVEEEEEEEEEEEVDDEEEEVEDDELLAPVRDGDSEPPSSHASSDVEASIAKQLREEVIARSKIAAKVSSKRKRATPPPGPIPLIDAPPEPEPPKEFTSFFDKRHQRDAALSRSRRRGRTVLAWGHPIPQPPERDFDLPEECLDEEFLRTHARRKRRDKRVRS